MNLSVGGGSGNSLHNAGWVLPAQVHGGDAALCPWYQLHGVDGSGRMPCAKLSGVNRVVAEIFIGNGSVFVADKPVLLHHVTVKLHLNFGVQANHLQRGHDIVYEQIFRFFQRVDVAVVAVALVGQLFHHDVVVVAQAKADGGKLDAGIGVAPNLGGDAVGAGVADVGYAVTGQDDAVDAVEFVGAVSLFVAQQQACFQIGGAFGVQRVDGAENGAPVGAVGGGSTTRASEP